MNEALKDRYKDLLSVFLTKAEIKKLFTRLERISHKISPINLQTGNTQTIQRWQLPTDNPNFASEEECDAIFFALIEDLLAFFGVQDFSSRNYLTTLSREPITKEVISNVLNTSTRIGSLELPIDYKIQLSSGGRHKKDNIFWFAQLPGINDLREWIDDSNVTTKIQVKAFLTDRRQTGDFQTNREVRWETDPHSPQYASRQDCIKIEAKLLAQTSTFTNAPELPTNLLPLVEKVLNGSFARDSFRCPISGKQIYFQEFVERISSPVHGRSGFQVGHLNPLATSGGHVADNISWITDLGNRVQGDSSLEEIINDIFYMAAFHKSRLGLSWEEVEDRSRQAPR